MNLTATVLFHCLFVILVGSSVLESSLAWSADDSRPTSGIRNINRSSTGSLYEPLPATKRTANGNTRRNILRQGCITAALATIGTVAGPRAALADVTNKVASSTALRALKRAQDQLPSKVLPEAQRNNFVGIKARLREAPFDELRKNALILVRGGEDGPKAKELLLAYKQLIGALEAMDATASLGMKGRSVDPFRLGMQYEDVSKALESFVNVGTGAAAIPLQESPSMQDNLRYGSIDTKVLKSD
mmetsp:Transcript_9245/g.27545  ORF Transcript_9245/g.27545 Transcript_9245/m.27545 type:complete len:245 (-) Transcript_9245:170-904(-)|eukprot:CAMPEP_0172367302 /NCGR_PEP_ID=MMETSP1060-20121228/20383_1 /TAXON_ID=37318 /ORGANISM="Pseudo-nitzschia pungens, Strain cf. cingulata" /LENGTH=244 /DNA_ID=CAMNT_0013091495 /DNA_START=127 /DNA_END=861 /DNA_ORIENTATION=-